jgi:hypothetical protein
MGSTCQFLSFLPPRTGISGPHVLVCSGRGRCSPSPGCSRLGPQLVITRLLDRGARPRRTSATFLTARPHGSSVDLLAARPRGWRVQVILADVRRWSLPARPTSVGGARLPSLHPPRCVRRSGCARQSHYARPASARVAAPTLCPPPCIRRRHSSARSLLLPSHAAAVPPGAPPFARFVGQGHPASQGNIPLRDHRTPVRPPTKHYLT